MCLKCVDSKSTAVMMGRPSPDPSQLSPTSGTSPGPAAELLMTPVSETRLLHPCNCGNLNSCQTESRESATLMLPAGSKGSLKNAEQMRHRVITASVIPAGNQHRGGSRQEAVKDTLKDFGKGLMFRKRRRRSSLTSCSRFIYVTFFL